MKEKVRKMENDEEKSGKTRKEWLEFYVKLTNYPKICIHNLIFGRIYSIISTGRVLKTFKRRVNIYFKQEIKILYKRNVEVF